MTDLKEDYYHAYDFDVKSLEPVNHRAKYKPLSSCIQDQEWKTKDCKLIKIVDMSSDHLLNSLLMCRKNSWRTAFIPLLEKELKKRKIHEIYPEYFI